MRNSETRTLYCARAAGAMFMSVLVAGAAHADTVRLEPGPNAQERVQEALILAQPGQTIELAAGTFEFTMGLSLDVDNVTVRGAGMAQTVLSFRNQDASSEGLLVTSSGVTLEDFAIEDAKGDAIKSKGSKGITFRNIRTEWTGGPKPTNGAYGLYPVESRDVLIEGCVSIGASDAGIYVGQSENIIVRYSRVEYNVAGIEIENCYVADVYENVAMNNTGGILIFDLPDLPQQGGRDVRVFNNLVVNNNHPNFAPEGNIVAGVPPGTGTMIMANRNVEVFQNIIRTNQTANISIISYLASGNEIKDPNYDPYPERIHIHDNVMGDGGRKPGGELGLLAAGILGTPLPDVVWDGMVNPTKLVDGAPHPDARISIHDNGDATFGNFDLAGYSQGPEHVRPSRDASVFANAHPSLGAVEIQGSGE